MIIEKRKSEAFGNVVFISDGKTGLAAALDYGLRIVHFARAGEENLLYRQDPACADGVCTPQGWRLYGGHRFWTAPESEKSYYPDNAPVGCTLLEDGARLRQETDPWTGFQKELEIRLLPDGGFRVEHILTNRGDAPVSAAPWGVTTLRGGGTAVVPFPPTRTGETVPRRVAAFWGGTRPDDPRLRFRADRAEIRWDAGIADYFKIGLYNSAGTASYQIGERRFTVTFPVEEPERCPDLGCNTEVFVNRAFLELETLGRFQTVPCGETVSHTEVWRIE